MAEAALAMRDVMSQEEGPQFVIRDLRYVKESTMRIFWLHIFNCRWLYTVYRNQYIILNNIASSTWLIVQHLEVNFRLIATVTL